MTLVLPPAGVVEKGAHYFPVRVYYDSTDAGGVVYHSQYLALAERARTEFLRCKGIEQRRLFEVDDCLFAVRRLQIEYKVPAYLDDSLVIKTVIEKVRGARLEILQTIKRENKVLAVLHVEVALIDGAGAPKRIVGDLLEKLKS